MNEKDSKIAVCMPIYNESEGIQEFITEIASIFSGHEIIFYAVDDCSTDSTENELNKLKRNVQIKVYRNPQNLGHGPSTIKALKMAISNNHGYIVVVDGDGQFLASEIYRLTLNTIRSGCDIGIGLRIRKQEPLVRRIISFSTRILVFLKTFKLPFDANTPLRVYKYDALVSLTNKLDPKNPIPNLFLSKAILNGDFEIYQEKVIFSPRRGASKTGTSWGKTLILFPQKRLILFCWNAIIYWFKN